MGMDPGVLEGLRRNSGVHLTKDGVFEFRGRPVDNVRVRELFHRGLAVRDDGEVTLTVGVMWAYVTCEGVARFVRAMNACDGVLSGRLLDGANFSTAEVVIGYGPDDRFYLWVDGKDRPAIALREAHQFLASRGVEGPAVADGAVRWPIHQLASVPTPLTPAPA